MARNHDDTSLNDMHIAYLRNPSAGADEEFISCAYQKARQVFERELRNRRISHSYEDLYEEVFMKRFLHLMSGLDKIEKGKFTQYLFRAVMNAVIDGYRRHNTFIARFVDTEVNGTISTFTHSLADKTDSNQESLLLRKEANAAIRRALREIPAHYAQPLIMSVEGYSYEEIAREMEIPEGTVKSRINRGKEQLASPLRRLGYKDATTFHR
jgi:RNA polymerase sigma-70 factor, ECF subfamily